MLYNHLKEMKSFSSRIDELEKKNDHLNSELDKTKSILADVARDVFNSRK